MDRIDELTADCFNFLIQLRRLDPASQPPAETIHRQLRSLIDTMARRGQEMGISREDVQQISYAVVALADEVAIHAGGPLRQYWVTRPLQLHYFNENIAGERFFDYLEALRQDGQHLEALKVYYLCLALGFQGRYAVRGGEAELANIIDAVGQTLARAGMLTADTLSPHGDRPPERRGPAQSNLPVVGLSIGAVVLALGLFVGLRWSLSGEVDAVLQRIAALMQS